MGLSPGTRLGTYKITGPLGAGGMGEVYRARDTRLGRDIAVKVLPDAVASFPDRLARFEREAKIVARLNHPNIVVLHSKEEEGGIHFLTMELVEGQSLANLITPGGLPLLRVLELSTPVAGALVAAHDRGVVHRDLKPGNVMVTGDGMVKVLDFGLAKSFHGELSSGSELVTISTDAADSVVGRVVGTVPYMAPEQLRGEFVDPRADLFALGVLLYELATGRRPFTGATSAEVISSILRDSPEPLSRCRADLPGDLERIVSRCLEKNPRERAQSARDVYNELRRMERGELSAPAKPAAQGGMSIAVLPFVNRSHDEGDEYFSDGLADELLNMLAKIRGLRVVARASSYQFKERHEDLAVIGAKLNVATLLDGTVRKAGNRVRIAVQLVKVADGYHLWSETYDRTLEDIFAVQDDIAQSVVKELRAALLGEGMDSKPSVGVEAEVAEAWRGRGKNPEAHRLYLQARYLIDRLTREESTRGIRYLKEALELDPGYALAWAELGRAYAREATFGWIPVAEGFELGRKVVKRALQLEPNLTEGHAGMAWIQLAFDRDWNGADESIRRAMDLAPGNAMVLRRAGVLALTLGHVAKAVELGRRAMEQDPLSAAAYQNLGSAFHVSDRFAEADEAYRKALELAPQRGFTHAFLSLNLLGQGRSEEALAEAMREPSDGFRLWALSIIYYALGQRAESDAAIRELVDKHAEDFAFQVAEVHGARGEMDAAFEWLERADALRDAGLHTLRTSPRFRSLHRDPRWAEFLKRMGFEE